MRRFTTLAHYVGRGVATTASYEARVFGVHSAMGLMKAAKLAPDAILLPSDFEAYREYSHRFKAAVATIAPAIENRGIDEIYIDLSDVVARNADGRFDRAAIEATARAIKSAVTDATTLSCSIAIAPNKLLAKIGSDLEKPDGLVILDWDDVSTRIWPLAAKKINGIGPKASVKLAAMGIATIGQLAQADLAMLAERFGPNTARWMHEVAHGRGRETLSIGGDAKSISRETTFERDLHAVRDRAALGEIFTMLCEKLAGDLQTQRLRRAQHRPEAALRRLHHRDPRDHAADADAGRARDPPGRRRVRAPRAARTPHPSARRARGHADARRRRDRTDDQRTPGDARSLRRSRMTHRPRIARHDDIPRLAALIAESGIALSRGFYDARQAEAMTRHVYGIDTQLIVDGTYYAIDDGDAIVACGGWSRRGTLFGSDHAKAAQQAPDPLLDPAVDAARIRAFFVSPRHARLGLGSALMTQCARAAWDAGFRRLTLVATLPGEPLYARFGFVAEERFELELPDAIRAPLVRMSRDLDGPTLA